MHSKVNQTTDPLSPDTNKPIIMWLYICAFMVFAMAIIGAITRLTESGLSMVEWKPLIGAIPPLSQAEWERVFALYRETPEFIHKNSWMGLEDFKGIFFWEWFHRLWGRLIGLVYALPLLYFWVRRQIPRGYGRRLLLILALGGMQGVMGWYMVMSGLADVPAVSHFRLAAHLSLALVIFAALVWTAMDLGGGGRAPVQGKNLLGHGILAMGLLAVTIVWGAFTAGLDAGMLYNTWPKMDAHWVPPEVAGVLSMVAEPGAVQFTHRWIAIVTLIGIGSFAWRTRDFALGGMAILQVGLGIVTVLTQVAIPMAAAHQAGGIVLLALLLRALHSVQAGRRTARQGLSAAAGGPAIFHPRG